MAGAEIPLIDLGALFGADSAARAAVDSAILAAAADPGFFLASGLEPYAPLDAASRARLLQIFGLSPPALQPLWRRKFAPGNPNVYRGFFPGR